MGDPESGRKGRSGRRVLFWKRSRDRGILATALLPLVLVKERTKRPNDESIILVALAFPVDREEEKSVSVALPCRTGT